MIKNKKGFTLIELLLVIAILGILAWLITPNMLSSLKKGRDARRKQDLGNIQKALEMYYEDKKAYPSSLIFNAKFCEASCADGEKVYMQKVPTDPSSNSAYSYFFCPATDGQSYQLYASLENVNDFQIIIPDSSCTLNCGSGHSCNYGISTSNTNP